MQDCLLRQNSGDEMDLKFVINNFSAISSALIGAKKL